MTPTRQIPWFEQPQNAVNISNEAVSLQCVVASLGSVRGYNSAAETLPRSIGTDVLFVPSQHGLSQRGNTTGGGVAYGTGGFSTLVPVASEWTIMLLVRVVTLGTRAIILGDFSSGGTNESVVIEQTATNTWRGGWVTTAPTTRQVNAGTVTTGWHWIEWQSATAASTLWVDGEVIGTTTGTSNRRAGTDYRIGMPGALTSTGFSGNIAAHFVFASALSESSRAEIRKNPWQLFAPRRAWIPQSVATGAYTLNAETGSYTFTGSNATLLHNYALTLDSASYSLTGSHATLLKGLILDAASGSYTLTGSDATFVYNKLLNASSGSYSISGADANLIYTPGSGAYTLNAESGAYVLTGSDVTFSYSGGTITLKAGSWIRYRIIT